MIVDVEIINKGTDILRMRLSNKKAKMFAKQLIDIGLNTEPDADICIELTDISITQVVDVMDHPFQTTTLQ